MTGTTGPSDMAHIDGGLGDWLAGWLGEVERRASNDTRCGAQIVERDVGALLAGVRAALSVVGRQADLRAMSSYEEGWSDALDQVHMAVEAAIGAAPGRPGGLGGPV